MAQELTTRDNTTVALGNDSKRRLPVIQSSAPEPDDDAPPRPPWRWIPIGATATFLVWLPLAAITERAVRHLLNAADARGEPIAAAGIMILIGHALAFATGAFTAGVLVGRLGESVTRREPSLGGALAAAIAWLIATNQGTPGGALVWGLLLAILCTMGATFGAIGGALGQRWRRASSAKKSQP